MLVKRLLLDLNVFLDVIQAHVVCIPSSPVA
jgi:hypothetical protein